jgi:glycosyltransferase involved in cell wall biosynthesis
MAPARFWKWRMFGAATALGRQVDRPHDVVLATDMLDLPALLGRARRHLSDAKAVLYMHENQVTYPLADGAPDDESYGFLNWRSMEVADEIWVNSRFHLDQLGEGLPRLLRRFPDERHDRWVDEVLAKAIVMPVGIEVDDLPTGPKTSPPLIVWNHRWEYDKDPEAFFAALREVEDLPWRLALLGESFRNEPTEFDAARERWSDRVVAFGYLPRDQYARILGEASICVSTARQEFFGISVLEAAASGALPLVPDRLAYPSVIPREFYDTCLYGDLSERLHLALAGGEAAPDGLSDAVRERFGWQVVAPDYDRAIAELAAT